MTYSNERNKKIIQSYIELLELEDPEKGEVDKLSKYKAIFAKSFFNVTEKPISDEDKEEIAQLNQLGGDEITPVGELDYSQAKIPSSPDEYKEAYERARKAVLKEVKANYGNADNRAKLAEAKLALSSKDLVIREIKKIDLSIGNRLGMLDNGAVLTRIVVRAQSDLRVAQEVAQNHAQVLSHRIASLKSPERANELGLAGVVSSLSAGSNSINQRLTKLGITPAPENQPQSQGTPSPSPRETKAYCLSGMLKEITNFKTPKFVKSIYERLRSNLGVSKGGGGR